MCLGVLEPPAGARSSSTTIGVGRRVLGDDHPDTLVSIHNIGGRLRELGRLEEAEALGAEAVDRARRTLPEGHWYTGGFLKGSGQTLTKLAAMRRPSRRFLKRMGPSWPPSAPTTSGRSARSSLFPISTTPGTKPNVTRATTPRLPSGARSCPNPTEEEIPTASGAGPGS